MDSITASLLINKLKRNDNGRMMRDDPGLRRFADNIFPEWHKINLPKSKPGKL